MDNQQSKAQSGTTYPGTPDHDAGNPPVSGYPQGWTEADVSVGDAPAVEARDPEGSDAPEGSDTGDMSQHAAPRRSSGGF